VKAGIQISAVSAVKYSMVLNERKMKFYLQINKCLCEKSPPLSADEDFK
jgi:hypothetical protein